MSRVHVFGDEAGDLAFKPPAPPGISRYFIIGTVAMDDCSIAEELTALRRELAWNGVHLDEFHATVDKQRVRDRVYDIIAQHDLRFDATILDKRKAFPYTYSDPLYFYKLAWYLHFKDVAPAIVDSKDELLVVASSLQIKRKKKTTKAAVHKAVTEVVNQVSPTVICHCAFTPAKTDPCLQVADYMTWAVQRKFEMDDSRSYELIEPQVGSIYQPFLPGTKNFY
ncbi:MAG TPA: DUF3800 domain-containing protein [Solirubrobacterales bacterium]|nr:DUF3800 domain-containing protein [Solirubrobacterales bacterium]